MIPRCTVLALSLLPLATLSGQVVPTGTIDLLEEDSFRDFVYHLSEKNSLSTRPEEVARLEEGVLQVTGKGFGYLRTRQAYRDYHLVAEYKWGERTWSKREDRARDCGFLLHCHGPDGSFGGSWISCIQAQMLEGSTGDINVLQGKDADGELVRSTVTCEVVKDEKGGYQFRKGGEAVTFPLEGKTAQSIRWKDRDPQWKDVKGFRGKDDVENPVGEWNRLEVICEGETVRIFLNGVLVNEGRDVRPAGGWIGIQNEWAECWFRRLELWPLGKFKEKWKPQAASQNTGYSETGESILPRRFPLSAEESSRRWRIDGDYELQLVACEPLTCDPVDVAWDAHGRMFVAEMRDYPLPPEGGPLLSRIRLLKDHDGDGRMDEAVTWADHLDHVQGLLPLQDGLLATTRTAILHLRDTDGDDRADEIRPLFHSNEPRHNQLQISSPRWGADNAIYLNNGLDGKEIYPHAEPAAKLEFNRFNLRYDPSSGGLAPATGHGQYGATFDDFGRHFFCSNRNPAMFAVLPQDTLHRDPLVGIPLGYEDIQPPAAPVWPVTLSHTTAAAHAGTHTAACGLAVYRGELLPDLRGHLLVCEPTAQLVTRNRLVEAGASLRAERVGVRRDFLVSTDEWCRPVQLRNGPDGALYICDMYRRFIDHARFFPDEFAASHYMRAGVDHGRIWRLVRKGTGTPAINPLPGEAAALVERITHPGGWQRIHAQRLIVERRLTEVVPDIRRILAKPPEGDHSAASRIHALWTLVGLQGLQSSDLATLLGDSDPHVIENALLACARALPEVAEDPALRKRILQIRSSGPARPRCLAFALWSGPAWSDSLAAHVTSALRDFPGDRWLRKAALSSDSRVAGPVLLSLLSDQEFGSHPAAVTREVLQELAELVAARADLATMKVAASRLTALPAGTRVAIVTGFGTGLPRGALRKHGTLGTLSSLPDNRDALQPVRAILEQAPALAADPESPVEDRTAALALVSQLGARATFASAATLVEPTQPADVQRAACRSLARYDRAEVASFFFQRWDRLGPVATSEAIELLTASPATGLLLMEKMKSGEISPSLMPAMQRWSYCRSADAKVQALAQDLFGTPDADRAKVIARYRSALANHPGDPIRGRAIFERAACSSCHRLKGIGVGVGPDLADVRIKPPEALLVDLLDPNRMVEERWVAYSISTKDGQTVAGLVTAENPDHMEVTLPGGASERIARGAISSLTSHGLSLMPVGLESSISEAEMADLLAFLRSP